MKKTFGMIVAALLVCSGGSAQLLEDPQDIVQDILTAKDNGEFLDALWHLTTSGVQVPEIEIDYDPKWSPQEAFAVIACENGGYYMVTFTTSTFESVELVTARKSFVYNRQDKGFWQVLAQARPGAEEHCSEMVTHPTIHGVGGSYYPYLPVTRAEIAE